MTRKREQADFNRDDLVGLTFIVSRHAGYPLIVRHTDTRAKSDIPLVSQQPHPNKSRIEKRLSGPRQRRVQAIKRGK